jgi:Protein of unknown function (DUF3237)
MTLDAPALEHVCDLRVVVAAPVEAGRVSGLNSRGKRRIIPIIGGTMTGSAAHPTLEGRVLPGGADFQIVVSDTCAELDARYVIALDGAYAGEHIFVMNRALRRGSAEDIAKLVRGEAVDPLRIYFRCAPTFEVSAPALKWMTESIFVGSGARSPDCVHISLYRLI